MTQCGALRICRVSYILFQDNALCNEYLAGRRELPRITMMELTSEEIARLVESVDLINDQHKKIFDLSNELFKFCNGDEDAENNYFGLVCGAALDLVKEHFDLEEELMLDTKFSLFLFMEHKKEHMGLIKTLTQYINEYDEKGRVDLLSFASYVKWWVVRHIKGHDKQYVEHFNNIVGQYDIQKMHV
jgi:hemerythrin-like metal-binding protein